jgi:peptidoglycan/LPS O-acetylase OafA/YrhL
MKGLAILWIFLNHIVEQVFGYPFIANPNPKWPSLSERIAQLVPLEGHGLLDLPLNVVRYLGWSGDQGVQLFLIVSGFGLTWGLLRRYGTQPLPLRGFYLRRAARIYPMWWMAHGGLLITGFVVSWGIFVYDPELLPSLLGIRLLPGTFYYGAPAWWYIGLMIQLYAVYPLVWSGLTKWGPARLLSAALLLSFAARAVVLYVGPYMDAWQRGGIFVTRLPEFAFGVALAAWMIRSPDSVDRKLRSPGVVAAALGIYTGGTALALTLPGMIVAPFALGLGAFVIAYGLLALLPGRGRLDPLSWIGRHSYSVFLVHHPLVLLFVPQGASPRTQILGIVATLLLTIPSALALEWFTDRAVAAVKTIWNRGARFVVGGALLCLTLGLGLVVTGEWLVRRYDPQEVLGWGERQSLEPREDFGWRMKPDEHLRLRWEGYDYEVWTNSLGFPGPEYSSTRGADAFRIITTGDAFTSAEGVDTDQAWPRRLETVLGEHLGTRPVEVLNFAVTGYGPNQYAAVLEEYVPVYLPDLILISMFVNEFGDVLTSNERFQQSIGFDKPPPDSTYAWLRLLHLRKFLQLRIAEPLASILRGRPHPHAYFLAHLSYLERGESRRYEDGALAVEARLSQIKSVGERYGIPVVLVLVPTSVQVCGTDGLAYPPRNVDLHDESKYDMERPQRVTKQIAERVGLSVYDLTSTLRSAPGGCPYQPRNMHWLPSGHDITAAYLAERLVDDGWTARPAATRDQ